MGHTPGKLSRHPGLIRAATALAIAGLVFGACSSGSSSAPATNAPGATTGSGGGSMAGKTINIADVRWDPGDIFFNAVQYGQEKEFKAIEEAEGVTINYKIIGAANDAAKQVVAFQTALDQKYQGIMHTPWKGEAMIPLLQTANDAGVPVVVENIAVAGGIEAYVAIDAKEAGLNSAKAIVAKLDELHPGWQAKPGLVIALRCIVDASFDIGRYSGFTEVFDPIKAANPDLTIVTQEVGCDGDKARKAVDDALSRYGKDSLLAVWSIDGTGAVGGVLPALDAAGLLTTVDDPKYIPVTTVDGTGPEMDAIAKGYLLHSSQQPAIAEGQMAARVMYEYIKLGLVPRDGYAIVPPADDPNSYDGWTEVPITDDLVIYPEGKSQYIWQPVSIVKNPVATGPWYVLPVVNVPEDIKPDDPQSWPKEYAATGK